jgi:hypothetical protein
VPGTPLTDDEVYDRLHKALLALGRETGETTRGNTAIHGARTVLQLFQLGLIAAMEKAEGQT